MKISNIELLKTKTEVTLAADITFRGKKTQRAYITTDQAYSNIISTDASPFLAAMLLPCMKTKEPIYVQGSVSQDLLQNTQKIMQLVSSWNIGLTPVDITVEAITLEKPTEKAIASFFTAGVDSFYTYLKHKKTKQPITRLILVHGFDISLSNQTFFKEIAGTVKKVAKQEGIEAIILKTNLGEIAEQKLVWDFAHGGALAAVAYFLRNGLKLVHIPGAVRDDQLFPYGTHPQLDKLWATKTMQVRSDGGEYDRIQKVMNSIAQSPLALNYLRVCTQNIKGKYNCSRCYKCLITMLYLVCAGSLSKAKTFTRTVDSKLIKNMYYDYQLKYNIQGEMALALLQEQKREIEIQEALIYSLLKSKKTKLRKRVAKIVASWDQKYNDRRLYQLVFSINKQEDRNAVFSLLFKLGVLK